MKPFAPREWSATLGVDGVASLTGIYVFLLVLALLIGVAPLPRAAIVAVVIWTCGALTVAAGSGYLLSRFQLQASGLLLPGRRAVLARGVLWLSGLIIVLPSVSFWMLVPDSRPWMALIMAVPLAALSMSLWLRPTARRSAEARNRMPYPLHRTSAQAIGMFIGRPFTPLRPGLQARAGAAASLILWAAPAALCLILPPRVAKILITVYVTLTIVVIWGWFMVTLARFGSSRSGNFSELALLPGLGDAVRRRHALYRAILARPLLLAFCGLSGFVLFTCWQSHSPGRIGRSVLCSIVLLPVCCGMIFQPLMVKGITSIRVRAFSAINSTFILLFVSQGLVNAPAQPWFSYPAFQWCYYIFLAAFAGVPLTLIWLYTSGLSRQAHPFLALGD